MNKILKRSMIVLAALILSLLPFCNLIIKTYGWHITQPEFIQGGIELIVAGILMILGWKLYNNKILVPFLLCGSIYCMLNGVVLPIFAVVAYFFIIWYIGTVVGAIKKEEIQLGLSKNFVSGICIWGVGAIILSLLGIGTINDLRIYTILLFIIAVFLGKSKNQSAIFDKVRNAFQFKVQSFSEIIPLTILFLIILALCAKTNTAQDYDSLWYGLRPEYVLVGNSSFYDDLGYAATVYYYPKLVELFYLPISGFGDYSFLQCANIGIFALVLNCINNYIKTFMSHLSNTKRWLVLSMMASIPALANISATAKPDIFGLYFVILAFYYSKIYFQNKDCDFFIYSILCLVLCTGTKQTYFLWGGLLFLWIVIKVIYKRKSFQMKKICIALKENVIFVFSAVFFICGIHYRTVKLTGYPTYRLFINVWDKLGFKSKQFLLDAETAQTVGADGNDISVTNILHRLYEFIIDPTTLEHVVMLWTTNLVVIALLILVLCHKKRINKGDIFLGVMYLFVMLYYMVLLRAPDGNYFLMPIVTIVLLCMENCCFFDPENNKLGKGVWLILIITMMPIMFVSHSSWAWGTKAFTTELIADNFDTKSRNEAVMEYNGISLIYSEVVNYSVTDRVIASDAGGGSFYFRLPCALETFHELSIAKLANTSNIKNYENFRTYLDSINVKALIVTNDDATAFAEMVNQYIEEKGTVNIISDQGATCYVVR